MGGKKAVRRQGLFVRIAPCGGPFSVGYGQTPLLSQVMFASTMLSGGASNEHWH